MTSKPILNTQNKQMLLFFDSKGSQLILKNNVRMTSKTSLVRLSWLEKRISPQHNVSTCLDYWLPLLLHFALRSQKKSRCCSFQAFFIASKVPSWRHQNNNHGKNGLNRLILNKMSFLHVHTIRKFPLSTTVKIAI